MILELDPAGRRLTASQIATSENVDLGDDEDPEVMRAMIRHIYDLPYDQMLEENTANDDSAAYSTNEDLLFHIGVFTAADKYDVASLRPLVVKKFEDLMETNWEGESFATSIQKLIGPSASPLADNTLRAAAAAFCAKNIAQLVKKDAFVKMIHEEEPFIGRLLTGFLNNVSKMDGPGTIQLKVCSNTTCPSTKPSVSALRGLTSRCAACGNHHDPYYPSTKLVDYKKAQLL